MSHLKLKDRIDSYRESSDYKLLGRVPLIVCVNGRNFAKATSLLDKPYDFKLAECMHSTMIRLCHEIEGALFAYHFNDEIILVARNDQNLDTSPWFDNKVQKICSITSSIATSHFDDCATSINLNLTGDPIFYSQIFAVPNIMEAINTIIYKQQNNFLYSVQSSCLYELLKKYEKNTIKEMLSGLNMDEKIDLLQQECNVDFNNYPVSFRRGTACYKIPKIVNETIKNKWFINNDLPIFTKDQSFLTNIFKHGSDIFREASL